MIEVFMTLVALILVLVLAFFTTRWLGTHAIGKPGGRMIKVLDRVMVAQDKMLIIVEVGGKTMLLAMSGHSTEKLCELDPMELPDAPVPMDFATSFNVALKDWRQKTRPQEGGEDH